MSCKILVSAGEVSGDKHLAKVISALRAIRPDCVVRGMAGEACRQAGVELDVDCYQAGAGMGFLELFRSGGKVLSSFRILSSLLKSWKPDLLVIVDYPDFNLRLAKIAKRLGVRVLYYIPPKVWAWRKKRVRTIARYVDRVVGIFPFEPQFYEENGYRQVSYLGHPLADEEASRFAVDERDESILLLAGSRRFEVERLLVPLLQASERLTRKFPRLKPVVLLAPNISVEWAQSLIAQHISPHFLESIRWSHAQPLEEMCKARVGVLKSGTCNLEGAVAELPFVCVYSGTLFAKMIVSLFVTLREYSPVNIIRPGTVRELMRTKLAPDELAAALEPLINQGSAREQVIDGLRDVAQALKGIQTAESVAERVAQCIAAEVMAVQKEQAGQQPLEVEYV
jgi:lipid-A-disaccharide synthase